MTVPTPLPDDAKPVTPPVKAREVVGARAKAGSAIAPGVRTGAMTQAMQIGLHTITVLLVILSTARAISDGAAIAAALALAAAFLTWYALGLIFRARLTAPVRTHSPNRTNSIRPIYSWVGVLATIWIGAIFVSAEFIWLAFLLWLLAGRFLTLRGALIFSTIVFCLVGYAPIWHHGTTDYATIFGPLIGAIFAVGIARGYVQLLQSAAERERLVESLTRTQGELIVLQDEMALAQRHSGMETERARIARDIHDTVAQTLPSIRYLAHAARAGNDPAGMVSALSQVETLAAEGTTDVRRIVAALTPTALDNAALGAALARMLERIQSETGIVTELHVDEGLPGLGSRTEVALLRVAQSALANVRQHAHASRIVMSLIDAGETVRLDVIDDGVGFDATERHTSLTRNSSYGLGFIDTRLRELGGNLEIASQPGSGTELSASLPIHENRREM